MRQSLLVPLRATWAEAYISRTPFVGPFRRQARDQGRGGDRFETSVQRDTYMDLFGNTADFDAALLAVVQGNPETLLAALADSALYGSSYRDGGAEFRCVLDELLRPRKQYWALVADPQRYRIDAAIQELVEDSWVTKSKPPFRWRRGHHLEGQGEPTRTGDRCLGASRDRSRVTC
jgi:hypothetical protein